MVYIHSSYAYLFIFFNFFKQFLYNCAFSIIFPELGVLCKEDENL